MFWVAADERRKNVSSQSKVTIALLEAESGLPYCKQANLAFPKGKPVQYALEFLRTFDHMSQMAQTLTSDITRICQLMEKHLNLTGSFQDVMRRSRKHLPKSIHRRLELLAAAEAQLQHPRLAQTLDHGDLAKHARIVTAHLKEVDLADRRKGRALDIAVTMGIALLTSLALFVCVLLWRGFL